MPTFAVRYFYSASPDELADVRPTHRQWISDRYDEGKILASGPLVHSTGALLICRHDSAAELETLLDQDPFSIAGLIGERVIEEWNPVSSPWSAN